MEIQHCIEKFKLLEKAHPGQIPFSIHFDFKQHSGHVVFAVLVHGNEVGPLAAAIQCIEQITQQKIHYGGKVTFILANPLAAEKGVRFLESDLNRSFGHLNSKNPTSEQKRALEIMKVIERCDVFFDFHQTIMPSRAPFYIFPMNPKSRVWAQAAGGACLFVTRKEGASFSNAGMCSDEFARSLNKVGVTVELGEQGFHQECTHTAFLIMKRTLCNMDSVYLKKRSIEVLAKKNENFKTFKIAYREPFNHPLKRLNAGFSNFNKVTIGMVLGVDEFGNPIESKQNGFILFPKYPARNEKQEAVGTLPGELFVILTTQ